MSDPAFACDSMVGRLARWLRILGYDATYARGAGDARLVARARAEGRVLLTRDRGLAERRGIGRFLLVQSNDPPTQLREVVAALGLSVDPARLFRRCPACNGAVEAVQRESVRGLVPPYVYGTQRSFSRCAGCRRVYWPATHHDHMLRELEALFGEPGSR